MSFECLHHKSIDSAQPGKYLIFQLGGESYAIDVLRVTEIIGESRVTPVPNTAAYVKGVINLRGRILPVIDMIVKLGIVLDDRSARPPIIVVESSRSGLEEPAGLLVEEVQEVLQVDAAQLSVPPDLGGSVEASCLSAIARVGDKVVLVLDVDRLLAEVESASASDGGVGAKSFASADRYALEIERTP